MFSLYFGKTRAAKPAGYAIEAIISLVSESERGGGGGLPTAGGGVPVASSLPPLPKNCVFKALVIDLFFTE